MMEEKNIPGEEIRDNSIQANENSQPPDKSLESEEDKQQHTNNSKLPTNMEVHHHGHVHEKKKWKEYLFQFFMLFLAVFCGFLAEYQLEHLIENKREKQYIKSMIQDLKTDTAKLGFTIMQFQKRSLTQDTLLQNFDLIKTGFSQLVNRGVSSIRGFSDFIYTDGTIQQLKNSGGFRLIRKSIAVDSIMAYDAEVKKAMMNVDGLSDELKNMHKYLHEFFNFQALDKQIKAGKTLEQLEQEKFAYTFSNDKNTVGMFYNKVRLFNWIYNIVKEDLKRVKDIATRLIVFLQKEYHLENE